MKLLIDFFGEQIEDDFSLDLPEGFIDLKYQRNAVGQGYQMLKKYNGYFLAYVVGQILAVKRENPAADTSDLEAQIDRMVYGLYGVANDYVDLIDKKQRQ